MSAAIDGAGNSTVEGGGTSTNMTTQLILNVTSDARLRLPWHDMDNYVSTSLLLDCTEEE